jgi:amidohydrolase
MPESDHLKSDIDELVPDMVAMRLRTMGLEVQTGIAKTGVVGLLRGGTSKPGAKTIAIRADMDALPISD